MAGSEPAKTVRPTRVRETDERLLIEAAQQEPARFADLYENYFEMLYAYIARRVCDRAATEDLTAEVFHKALQNLPKFKWTGAPFAAWLIRIASNIIADRAKRTARERNVSLDESAENARAENSAEPVLTRGLLTRESQQTDLEDSEQRAVLFRMVADLAEDQRRVVTMRFTEEKSIREIASAIGRTEGAVKQLQFRALANLRKRIHQ